MMNIDERRKHGVFYTPKIWADYAHERLSNILGDNWREEFVVWDNCAGTCNLTKDYKFNELYISTLFESEVEEGMQFNPEAEHFQFDFLNDEIPNPGSLFNSETKIPDRLLDAFKKNKKILFLINPPYAAGTNRDGSKGTSATKTNQEMIADGYGKSAQNLYTQFLYRIEKLKQAYKLTDCYIGIFCPTLFMTGTSFDKFRLYFLNDFEYVDGFQFLASHFADVASNWGIGFTIWKSGISNDKENFEVDICDVDKNSYSGDIESKGKKCIYNLDHTETLREWVVSPIKKMKTYSVPTVSSGIKVKITPNSIGKMFEGAFGYMYFKSNNVGENALGVALFTTAFSDGHGFGINKDNFEKAMVAFSARKLIIANWINSKDEYLTPDESNPEFEEFVNDSVIFSLFHIHSNQSSLHNIIIKNNDNNHE